jgi:MFS family permease
VAPASSSRRPGARRRASGLVPSLPRRVWALQAGTLLTSVGTGLVLPFQLIYLHETRGLSLTTIGAVAATWPVAALLGGAAGGSLVDRIGPRPATALFLLVGAASSAGFAFVAGPWAAVACSAAAGLALGGSSPALSSLLAALVPAEVQHTTFAIEFSTANVGIAAGAALGGLVADVARPWTFGVLFLANSAASVVFAGFLVLASRSAPLHERQLRSRARTRDLLRNRALLGFAAITFLFALGGLAVWETAVPLFARIDGGLSERTIGFVFLANSVVIVVAQLPVARWLAGRRRLPAVAAALAAAALGWTVVGSAPPSVGVLLVAAVLYALCECVLAPIQGSLVADLAPAGLAGRAMALQSNAYALGMTTGPPAVALLLGHAPLAVWPLAAAILVAAAAAALALEGAVPLAARRVPVPEVL